MNLILRVALSHSDSRPAEEARRLLETRSIGSMPLLQRIAFSHSDTERAREAFRLLHKQAGHKCCLTHDPEVGNI